MLADGKYAGIGLTKSVKVLEGNDKKSPTAFVVTDGASLSSEGIPTRQLSTSSDSSDERSISQRRPESVGEDLPDVHLPRPTVWKFLLQRKDCRAAVQREGYSAADQG